MPTYDFECEKCMLYAEVKQSHKDPDILNCPECGETTLKKVFISAPYMSVRGEPKTIGHLADRNSNKLGTYERQDKEKENGLDQKREQLDQRVTRRKINSMTEEQKMKWIKDGD